MTATVPPIPAVPLQPTQQDLYALLTAIKTWIELRDGQLSAGTNTRFTTIQDLVDAAVVADGDIP